MDNNKHELPELAPPLSRPTAASHESVMSLNM